MPPARATKSTRRNKSLSKSGRSEVTLVSDDGPPPLPSAKRRKNGKTAAAPVDVIEISSDDEEVPPPPLKKPAKMLELEALVNKLKKKTEKAKRAQDEAEKRAAYFEEALKISQLKAATSSHSRPLIDPSKLEDDITCEICTLKMWSPCILPECGHTFCQSCLRNWFNTTLEQHRRQHPRYHPNQPIVLPQYLREMLFYPQIDPQQLSVVVEQITAASGRPVFTCPTCRKPVKNRPVEIFVIKSLVRTVAAAQGESSPRKETAEGRSRGKSKAPVRREGPWDLFFPPT
ncbi:uncharacterized protein BT62DRAFT_991778 [Guyanagaster necrorhizus]|uniref:RING-type domain-containing protein n=1 Tax=Guyanagaster necrorhizus TaxID=856835 RepID=A0A9P8AX67_9AGAR|nr:uncharacterized protein BT62DRAFT_991778 [Guyanagaster necrorhizus MCA 3950]KAG7449617.1 hypothetical protein BT62DRAFT_991778 [Guyanagaster necrorhizus MCA 3950]